MDTSVFTNKISSIKTSADLESYQASIASQFEGTISGIEAQLVQLSSLTNPTTFIANFIVTIASTIETITAQLLDIKNAYDAVNSAIAQKKQELAQ